MHKRVVAREKSIGNNSLLLSQGRPVLASESERERERERERGKKGVIGRRGQQKSSEAFGMNAGICWQRPNPYKIH